MLINNINNWFNNSTSHYTSQPNFNLSDYQQTEQNSSENSKQAKINYSRAKKNGSNFSNKKSAAGTHSTSKHSNQPLVVKKQIRNAFSSQGAKSKSTLNLNTNGSSNEKNNTEIYDLTSKTCSNFNHNHYVDQVAKAHNHKCIKNTKTKSTSHLDLSGKSKNNNVQLLPNGSNNPFTSNFDFVCKNTNSTADWSSRFKTRLNTNLSILDYKLNPRDNNNEKSNSNGGSKAYVRPSTAGNAKAPCDQEYKNYLKKIFDILKMNNLDEDQKYYDPEKKLNDSMFSLYYLTPNEEQKLNEKSSNIQKIEGKEIKNYFLSYRSPIKKQSDQNQKPPSRNNNDILISHKQPIQEKPNQKSEPQNSYLHLNSTKTTFSERVQNSSRAKTAGASLSSSAVRNMQLDEHRKRNGPEKYLEPLKIIDIKKWVEQVDRVQSIEGKCLETINKCRFYND